MVEYGLCGCIGGIGMIVVVLGNVAIVGVFAFLAIHFNKWWIVLFSILLMMGYKMSDDENDD